MSKTKEKAGAQDIKDLITQAEAARLRGVSRSAIQALVQRGRLRSVEMFGRNLVYRSEVVAFEREKSGPKKGKE